MLLIRMKNSEMKTFFSSLLVLVIAATSIHVGAAESVTAQPLRALLVTGGCCHDYENQKGILSEGISERANVDWTIVHEGGTSRDHKVSVYEKDDWAAGYDVVVHNECFGGMSDVAFLERITQAHREGVAGVVIHCSMHSYRAADTEEWRKMLGVTSVRHEGHRPVTVENLKPDHPIMAEFPDSWDTPNGELYIIQKVWPNTTPLAQAYGKDTDRDHPVIWTNTYGQGRIFGTTLGHHNSTMEHEVYLDMVARGLLWACDKLDKQGNPKPGYAAR